jgi:hypothetical protein
MLSTPASGGSRRWLPNDKYSSGEKSGPPNDADKGMRPVGAKPGAINRTQAVAEGVRRGSLA